MDKNQTKDLFARTFNWGDNAMVIGEQSVAALHYLIDMGAKQAFGDTAAAKAAFVGQKDNGELPKNPWSAKDREPVAKEMGNVVMIDGQSIVYSDDIIDHRRALATAYFAKKAAEKWAKIADGTLTVGSRGSAMSPDERYMYDAAERELDAKGKDMVANALKAMRQSDPELTDAKDTAIKKTLVAAYLDANRVRFEKVLADAKAAESAASAQPIDLAALGIGKK